jgi:hypothetical protein
MAVDTGTVLRSASVGFTITYVRRWFAAKKLPLQPPAPAAGTS